MQCSANISHRWLPSWGLSGKCCFSSSRIRITSAGVFLPLMASRSFAATVAPGMDAMGQEERGWEGGRGREEGESEGREMRGVTMSREGTRQREKRIGAKNSNERR